MYEAHFGLKEPPFSLTPDPRFLFLTRGHRDALAYLHYGIEERKGFLVLCGEVGVGKTLVIRTLLGQLPGEVETAIVMNARLSFRQLLYLALVDFGLNPPGRSKIELLLCLQEFLLRLRNQRANAVLIVDEAQNLTEDALEDFRLLSNLEAANTKLVQIVLVGQPELRRLLSLPSLRQLRQRIPGIFDLPRLTPDSMAGYVDFRLSVAGEGKADGLFTDEALDEVGLRADGIPRLVNQVCDRALLIAYAKGADRVRREHVREAAEELEVGGAERAPSLDASLRCEGPAMSNIYDALNKERQDGAPRPTASAPTSQWVPRPLPTAGDRATEKHIERIRQRIVLELGSDRSPVVVFTGAVPGEGTSTLALRFAREIALADSPPVLLVDGDLARGLGALSGVLQAAESKPGLSDLLAGTGELSRLVLVTEQPNLHFLPCGCTDLPNLELVRSDRVEEALREMTRHYAFVVIDAGALLAAPETALLASPTTGVVLVVRASRTRREVVQRAVEALNRARCRVLGVVLNDRRYPIPGFIYRRI